jgi:hypothetical protein
VASGCDEWPAGGSGTPRIRRSPGGAVPGDRRSRRSSAASEPAARRMASSPTGGPLSRGHPGSYSRRRGPVGAPVCPPVPAGRPRQPATARPHSWSWGRAGAHGPTKWIARALVICPSDFGSGGFQRYPPSGDSRLVRPPRATAPVRGGRASAVAWWTLGTADRGDQGWRSARQIVRQNEPKGEQKTAAVAAYLTALRPPKVPTNSLAALEKRRAQIEQWIADESSPIREVEVGSAAAPLRRWWHPQAPQGPGSQTHGVWWSRDHAAGTGGVAVAQVSGASMPRVECRGWAFRDLDPLEDGLRQLASRGPAVPVE